ncbi:MAG TPA: tetratricopeptide repeat protein [Opitutaceae bacterium]|nr:tetratricopeptide repeat protein [Opitutaceae bacterium]
MASATSAPAPGIRRTGPIDLLLGAVLFAAVFLAYLPALDGGRILDDDLHITRPELQSVRGLGRIWFEIGATQQYYPVLHSAFWLEHRLWGDAVAGYHLANVALHALASLLVVALMRRLRLPGAWLGGFLFALHPVAVESVAWIAEQKNTLSTVFALGAATAYLRFEEHRRRPSFWTALGLFALALLSKTAVVTLPAALLVIVWWRRGRLEWRRDFAPLLPWFGLAAVIGVVTVIVERRLLAGIAADLALTPVQRVLVAGRALWFYAGKLAWPAGLTFFYPRWNVDPTAAAWYLYLLATLATAGGLGGLAWARGRRGPLAAFLCFAGTMAPVLGFLNVEWFVFSFVADHLQYLSSVALLVPAAALAATQAERLPREWIRLAPAAAALAPAVLGWLTWQQCGRYRDPVTFYRTAAELSPASAIAHNHYGAALAVTPGRLPEAIAEFEQALRLSPGFAEIHENLGTALLRDPAHREDGLRELAMAARLRPDRKSAHDKLAFALAEIPGRLPETIAELRASLRIDPADPLVHDALGFALLQDPAQAEAAAAEFHEALRLNPDLAEAHAHLGKILAATPGGAGAALAEYETALRLQPGFADAHYSLGNLLLRLPGRAAEGRTQLAEAIRLRPDFAEAHTNLGIALLDLAGGGPEAIAHFEAALRARPDFAPAENSLGIALAQSGRLAEAAAHFAAAVRLDPNFTQARANLGNAQQLLQENSGPRH